MANSWSRIQGSQKEEKKKKLWSQLPDKRDGKSTSALKNNLVSFIVFAVQ